MKFGLLIKSICERASSSNQAAKKSKIAQSTLSEWQSDKVSPGLEKYVDLCLAMGCRPGFELDQHLGLGNARPRTAEDLLGMALALEPVEQQRLISLLAGKYSEYLTVQNMIDVDCLINLILEYIGTIGLTPEKFIKKSGITETQYTELMHGVLPTSLEEAEALVLLLSRQLKNPTTGEKFGSREELISYCDVKKFQNNESP
jgi:transcriptional regulator with XRE-family HTH domain